MVRVTAIRDVRPYTLALVFSNGDVKTVDLGSRLRAWSASPDSAFRQLLDPKVFAGARVNRDIGCVLWDNGIDLCPDALYQWAREQEGATDGQESRQVAEGSGRYGGGGHVGDTEGAVPS